MDDKKKIKLFIRLMPLGEYITIDTPKTATARIIIEVLIERAIIYKEDSLFGQLEYDLIQKRTGNRIKADVTFEAIGLEDEDILILTPVLPAKSPWFPNSKKGKLSYRLPTEIEVGKKSRVEVEISKNGFNKFFSNKGFYSTYISNPPMDF